MPSRQPDGVGIFQFPQKRPFKARRRRSDHRRIRGRRPDLVARFQRKSHISVKVHGITEVMVRLVPDFPYYVWSVMSGGCPDESHICRPCGPSVGVW